MYEIIQFAQSATPLMILTIAVIGLVYVAIKLSKGESIIKKISGIQDEKYPKIEHGLEIMAKLDLIANNHLHELPEMKTKIDKLTDNMDSLKDSMGRIELGFERRLTKVETLIDK